MTLSLEDLSLEEGTFLVKTARKAIENAFKDNKIENEEIQIEISKESLKKFSNKSGVFVTLERYPTHELRGCIGFPEPIFPLIEGVKKAAIYSAFDDPRFEPLKQEELNEIIVEVTVLTPPELIQADPKDYEKYIEIGRDGLIVKRGWHSGLLLPQVPVEWNWSKKEFLEETCIKAGLDRKDYLKKDTKVYKFRGIVFSEVSPNGKVVKRDLKTCTY